MRGFVDKNQQLGRDAIGQMVVRSQAQLWIQLALIRMMPYLPGRDFLLKKLRQQVQQAANAVQIKGLSVSAGDL